MYCISIKAYKANSRRRLLTSLTRIKVRRFLKPCTVSYGKPCAQFAGEKRGQSEKVLMGMWANNKFFGLGGNVL